MHLRNIFSAQCSINRLPFISLGDGPVVVAVPPPVQLRDALLHALNKSANRAHPVLRILGTSVKRGQGNDTVVHDDSNLLCRGEGGVGARQHCSREVVVNGCVFGSEPQETYTGIEYWSRRGQARRSGRTSSLGCGRRADGLSWRE